MLAKLIVWARTRELAVERMHRALLELTIDGVETSRDFHLRLMEDAEFRRGEIDIQWLEKKLPSLTAVTPPAQATRAAAIAAALFAQQVRSRGFSHAAAGAPSDAKSDGEIGYGWKTLARREALR